MNIKYGLGVTIGITLDTTLAATTPILIQLQFPTNSVTGVEE
jgi:hypothetical protein